MARTHQSLRDEGFYDGYQSAMLDIALELQKGGEDAVRTWVNNNLTDRKRRASVGL